MLTDNIIHHKNNENIYKLKNSIKYCNSKKIEVLQTINSNKKNIKYDFNIFEIIFAFLCNCHLSKGLDIKKNINEKSTNFLNNNLDIVTYIRNQILFDIINAILLDEKKKSIINFLCHPVISKNNDVNNNFTDVHRTYEEKDFNKFSQELLTLIQKPNKSIREKKLIMLSNYHLNNFFNIN